VISVEEALARLEAETSALPPLELPLSQARGRVLAQDLVADRDFPPTDRSAMDGFAVRAADATAPGVELAVVGELRAGEPAGALRLGPGQAIRIMTGSVIPPGADAVVMVERTREQDGRVRLEEAARPEQNIRRCGAEQRAGALAVAAGRPIRAGEVAALTSIGASTVHVHRAPVVHVLSTGDEIVEPHIQPAAHQVRNSNAHALVAQLAEFGLEAGYLGIAGDERTTLDRALERGLAGDVLLVTGGVSAGRYDLVGEALEGAGMRLLFHRVAIKPGQPILAGRAGSCLVLGLPGNPVSTFTTFVVFAAPVLRRLLGYRAWGNARASAVLVAPLKTPPGRETYQLAHLASCGDGLTATPVASAGSGDVLALARANGFIVTPREGASLAAGATVSTLPGLGASL